MRDFGVDEGTAELIYNAVRVGGSSARSQNAELKRRGEKRILKRFPDDPTIRWSDWKTRPDVFI